jgi:hypothetical protein
VDEAWLIARRTCICPDAEGVFLDAGVEQFPEVVWADQAALT